MRANKINAARMGRSFPFMILNTSLPSLLAAYYSTLRERGKKSRRLLQASAANDSSGRRVFLPIFGMKQIMSSWGKLLEPD
jgi:hypothetical protein